MQVIQVKLKVTAQEFERIKHGQLMLMGLLKDSGKKTVERHVPAITKNLSKSMTNKSFIIGIGIASAVSAIVFGSIAFVKHEQNKKHKTNQLLLADEYNNSFNNYIYEARKGTLSFNSLKKFTDYIDLILRNSSKGDIKLELSGDEVDFLYNLIQRFTKDLCEANNYQLPEHLTLESKQELLPMQKLEEVKEYLFIQKVVFKREELIKIHI